MYWLALLLGLLSGCSSQPYQSKLSKERIVIQTKFGDITAALYPEVAPSTAEHILHLFKLGCYNDNHFFRVDKSFVAQVQDVQMGRLTELNAQQKLEAQKKFPLEVRQDVKHVKGVLSMGRTNDPNSNGSSFSILLGAAPHLDMQYTIFGTVLQGTEVLEKMEKVETKREGIFVMPLERINIVSSYVYEVDSPDVVPADQSAAKTSSGKVVTLVQQQEQQQQQQQYQQQLLSQQEQQQGKQATGVQGQVEQESGECDYPISGLVGWAVAILVGLYSVVPRQKKGKLRS